MLSALLMLRRVRRALRYAEREEDFLTVFGAGVTLVVIGTVSYALGEGWNVVDGLYFAVATLTTTSVSDPDLVLNHAWMKIFTVFYS
jgi:Ion channel